MLNNIVLIGFMGCGKTTIGRKVANLYESILIDTDSIIETNHNMSVAEFFSSFGEKKFRKYEAYVCNWIKENVNNAVIATGGGTPIHYDLRDIGNVFYLKAPLNVLIERVTLDGISKRPMFDEFKSIVNLYDKRVKYYEKMADYTINAMENINIISQKICDYMKGY